MKLLVSVDEADIDRAVDDTFRKLVREVRVPGFRPGKVPRRVLEARMGPGKLREEAIRDLLPGYYEQAVHDAALDPIAAPEIDVTAGNDGGPLSFEAVVEVRPHVAIPGYKGLRVTVPSLEVTDREVDDQLDHLRRQSGRLSVVERPVRDGDFVTIDLVGRKGSTDAGPGGQRQAGEARRSGHGHKQAGEEQGGEAHDLVLDDYLYEMGTSRIVDGMDDLVRGAAVGDALEMDAEIASVPVHFEVVVKQVQEQILPEATDEWAREASELETVAELREDIRSRVALAKRIAARDVVRDKAIEALVELVPEDAPEPLVRAEIDRRMAEIEDGFHPGGTSFSQYLQMSGETREGILSELREPAVFRVKADLALRALAEAEDIEADDAGVDEEIGRVARQMRVTEDDLRSILEREDRLDALRLELRKTLAARWLYGHVEVVDEEGHVISYRDLDGEAEPTASGAPEDADGDEDPGDVGDRRADVDEATDDGGPEGRGESGWTDEGTVVNE